MDCLFFRNAVVLDKISRLVAQPVLLEFFFFVMNFSVPYLACHLFFKLFKCHVEIFVNNRKGAFEGKTFRGKVDTQNELVKVYSALVFANAFSLVPNPFPHKDCAKFCKHHLLLRGPILHVFFDNQHDCSGHILSLNIEVFWVCKVHSKSPHAWV